MFFRSDARIFIETVGFTSAVYVYRGVEQEKPTEKSWKRPFQSVVDRGKPNQTEFGGLWPTLFSLGIRSQMSKVCW
jgi:hypothetical protein